jgi:hypothetical protein
LLTFGWDRQDPADIPLLRHDLKLYIDVTLIRPTAESLLKRSGTRTTPLFSTKKRAKAKHKKYAAIAEVNGYRMIPFVIESYGGMGAEARTLLHALAKHSKEYSSKEFLLHARRRLSCALHSSNANIALLGIEQWHLQQHARNPCAHDAYVRERTVQLSYYAQLLDSDCRRRLTLSSILEEEHSEELDGGAPVEADPAPTLTPAPAQAPAEEKPARRSEIAAEKAAAELLGEIRSSEPASNSAAAKTAPVHSSPEKVAAFVHASRVGTAGIRISVLENEFGIDTSRPGQIQNQRQVHHQIDVSGGSNGA